MTDHEFREVLSEYLDTVNRYQIAADRHAKLKQQLDQAKLPSDIHSLDELKPIQAARDSISYEMRSLNSHMMQLATRKVDLERKIKEALPRGVRYHYAGREIYVKDHELHVIYEVKELAA